MKRWYNFRLMRYENGNSDEETWRSRKNVRIHCGLFWVGMRNFNASDTALRRMSCSSNWTASHSNGLPLNSFVGFELGNGKIIYCDNNCISSRTFQLEWNWIWPMDGNVDIIPGHVSTCKTRPRVGCVCVNVLRSTFDWLSIPWILAVQWPVGKGRWLFTRIAIIDIN